ncbi:MAG: glycerate dehydrogenase [Betaproteobacteria bacterium]|nr:glycerate dehydrogenase [Betaproteobacteria bacterium]
MSERDALIVVPDDFPSVFVGSAAHGRAQQLGALKVCSEQGADDAAELARRIGGATVAVNIRAYAHFTDAVFAACPNLKMVSIWGVGTDNVDLGAAARRGITVCNTPGANAIAVAEHAIALMMAAARKLPQIDRDMRKGEWPREMLGQLHGKTLAVLGTGAIGSHVIKLAQAFGMTVLTWSARRNTLAERDTFLKQADFVSLHMRLTPQTRGVIGARELALMKRDAILINTGRGALVDRDALYEALANRRIAGAGLDVFHEEPLRADDPVLKLSNTVLSPHNAGQTPEVRRDGLLLTIENVERFLAGTPQNTVSA